MYSEGTEMGSHGLGAVELIELARRLYGYEGEAWLATVPGVDFDHGEGLSPATREAIDHLAPADCRPYFINCPFVQLPE